jgi:hypothetical protein
MVTAGSISELMKESHWPFAPMSDPLIKSTSAPDKTPLLIRLV